MVAGENKNENENKNEIRIKNSAAGAENYSLNCHHVFLFRFEMLVDAFDVFVGHILNFFLQVVKLIFGNVAAVFCRFELVHRIFAGAADSDATLLGHVFDDFHEIDTAFFGELRDR